MSDELFYIDVRDEILQARMRGRWAQLREAMIRVITRLSIEVQGAVKETKLTGQVLHVRTGTLRRSINRKVEVEGDSVRATIGTNVEYAGVHEYGFNGTVSVPAYVRRSQSQMALARYRTNKAGEKIEIRGSYRKAGGGPGEINVRAHSRVMNMPERSYLRSTLREFRERIRSQIIGAVKGQLQ
jgi:phage gpG-like protein